MLIEDGFLFINKSIRGDKDNILGSHRDKSMEEKGPAGSHTSYCHTSPTPGPSYMLLSLSMPS